MYKRQGERLSVLSQDHFKWDAFTVMDTVMMGHTVLWDIMKQREVLYAKEDFTDEDGLKAVSYTHLKRQSDPSCQSGSRRIT